MSTTEIISVRGRRVWDSRGRPTVEAEVTLAGGALGRAIAPAGASTGSGEAVDLRDGGSRFGGADVMMAVGNVNGEIARILRGCDARDQKSIDDVLIALDGTPNKARLGANALVGTSMAVLHAAAAAAGVPLYAYLLGDRPAIMPIPEVQIFGGGAHAGRRVDIQDFMVVAPKARSFAEALEWTVEIYRAAGAMMSETGQSFGPDLGSDYSAAPGVFDGKYVKIVRIRPICFVKVPWIQCHRDRWVISKGPPFPLEHHCWSPRQKN